MPFPPRLRARAASLAAVLALLAPGTRCVAGDVFDLLALQQGKATDAKTAPIITTNHGWEIVRNEGAPPALVLRNDGADQENAQPIQFIVTLPDALRTESFVLTCRAEIADNGWVGITFRDGKAPLPLPFFSVGRGARGHANAQTSEPFRLELTKGSGNIASDIAVEVHFPTRTFTATVDGQTSKPIAFPEPLQSVATISFNIVAKDQRPSSATITNPILTMKN